MTVSHCVGELRIAERVVAIIWMTIGVCFFFFLIGSMSTFFNALDSKGKILAEKYMIINQFCTQANIDPQLKQKMKKALEYRTKNYYFALFEKNSLLEGIPLSLRYKARVLHFYSRIDRDEHEEQGAAND